MGYDRITSWVESHFNPRDYNSYFEMQQAIKERFNSDGIDLPKGAESQMMDHFEKYFEKIEPSVITPISMDTYTPPEPEILQINEDFFTSGVSFQEQQQQGLPDILKSAPEQPVSRQPTFFGRVSGFFKRLFGR